MKSLVAVIVNIKTSIEKNISIKMEVVPTIKLPRWYCSPSPRLNKQFIFSFLYLVYHKAFWCFYGVEKGCIGSKGFKAISVAKLIGIFIPLPQLKRLKFHNASNIFSLGKLKAYLHITPSKNTLLMACFYYPT